MASAVVQDLRSVVCSLVEQPEEVVVEEEDRGRSVLLKLTVAPDELGRVIGRQGRTVRALRTLLEFREIEDDVRYELKVLEP